MPQVMAEAMSAPYDLLFGRKTYDLFAGHWPRVGDDNPIARILNAARKYVATSSGAQLGWEHSERLIGDVPAEIARLKAENSPLLQVHGSWQLIQTLLAHGLIDEFRLWTFPVFLGVGKRLFDQGTPSAELKLVRSAACDNGVVMTIYRRA